MSDFLAGALEEARANLTTKRKAGPLHGKSSDPAIKKKAKWQSDKSAASRSNHDLRATLADGLSDHDLQRSRTALERKAKEYRRMFKHGTDMQLTGEAAENMLIDFDRKWAEGHRQDPSSSDDDDDENDDVRNVAAGEEESDPLIEVEDEFGRMRHVRASEAQRHERPVQRPSRPENLIYGRHLQTFNPDARKKDAIWAEEEASREVHYDPTREVRQRGTGYIDLGRGHDRKDRMQDLADSRRETVETRNRHASSQSNSSTTGPAHARDDCTEEFDHATMKQEVSDHDSDERERDAARIQTGAAFLDKIL